MKRHLKNLARRSMPGLFVVLTVVQADAAELYVAPDNRSVGIEESDMTGLNNLYLNNLVFGNEQDWELNNDLTPFGTVAAPPGFVHYDPDGKGNYRLTAESPAIDRGRSIEAPMVDYDGIPRPQGQGIDIGPFEFLP
jgi:hypothetical protein